ncbi:MAG: hypothetical protein V4456_01410 [Bacteroidota bacterium]
MKTINSMKAKITCIVFIMFATAFVAGCNSNSKNNKKADTVAQPNNQNGESEGMDSTHRGEMGNGHNGMDSTHRGMRHGPSGKDSSNSKKKN